MSTRYILSHRHSVLETGLFVYSQVHVLHHQHQLHNPSPRGKIYKISPKTQCCFGGEQNADGVMKQRSVSLATQTRLHASAWHTPHMPDRFGRSFGLPPKLCLWLHVLVTLLRSIGSIVKDLLYYIGNARQSIYLIQKEVSSPWPHTRERADSENSVLLCSLHST